MMTTPSDVPQRLGDLMAQAGIEKAHPVWLAPKPCAGAIPGDCFANAARAARRLGGVVVYGWVVWEQPRKVLVGEFHAVLRLPSGELRCVTPPRDGEPRLLFVPDPVRVYARKPVPNLRVILDPSDPAVLRAAALSRELERLQCKYADATGQPRIPHAELAALYRRFGIAP